MKKIELLAPAGTMESLIAAVQAGADAIYIGGSKFSARAYAGNFDEEEMKKAVEYCHLYGVKLYVALNTLLKEEEVEEAFEYAKFLNSINIDALIIQDVGLIYRLCKEVPDLELHASTQMTIHNGEGAKFLVNKGLKRVVLSRELSLEEIKHISKDLNIETEIFVHGALCVCYSGQCLMSSMIGGRSGNRGRCAQTCRLPYSIINKSTMEEKKGYLMSPKDVCGIEDIKEIIESGTSSLKIEGRMKRPEYVAAVVKSYRKAIDSYYNDNKLEVDKEKNILLQVFNREGFSKAYLKGNWGKDMMAYSFPKNTGVFLGRVTKDSSVILEEDLGVGDGIRIGEGGFVLSSIIKDGIEVDSAKKGDKVLLKPKKYKVSDALYKTSDNKLNKSLSEYYKNPYGRKINIPLNVVFKQDEKINLYCNYNGKDFSIKGDMVQKPLKKPLTKEKLEENLSKSADTPFRFYPIEFNTLEDGFIAISSLNNVRRQLIEKIHEELLKREEKQLPTYKEEKRLKNSNFNLLVNVSNSEQLNACLKENIESIAINPFTKESDINISSIRDNIDIYIRVPNIIKSEFKKVVMEIEEYIKNPLVKGILTSNVGIISLFKNKTDIIGDYKINIFNGLGSKFYEDVLNSSTISVELNKREIKSLCKDSNLNKIALVYGKIELMVSEYCPIGSVMGGKGKEKKCNGACMNGTYVLKDRMKEEFLIKTDKFCRSYIYNNVPLNLISNISEFRNMGINAFRIDFIDENFDESIAVLREFKSGKWSKEFKNFTRGHYKRGVE